MGYAVCYDSELRRHNELLRRAAGVRLHDRVLDIGCGSGQTTREAAGAARAGSALGVDVSATAIARARELARAEGLANVTFAHADAQTHRFAPGRSDVVISRFGTMFFGDPVAAFTGIGRALRPGGRLVMVVWQSFERNEWSVAVRRALGADAPGSGLGGGPDPFSLADPPVVREILRAAGFVDVDLTDVREPVCFGPDVAAALDWVRGFTCTAEVLSRLDAAAADDAEERLREVLAGHLGADGVWLGARAWLVVARRP